MKLKKCIIKLNNGKSGGADDILNEHIKSTIDIMMPVYIKLFNKVLSAGEVLEDWLVCITGPTFNQKGNKTDCNNYRGITLLFCLGKLFTSTLNEDLYTFCAKQLIYKRKFKLVLERVTAHRPHCCVKTYHRCTYFKKT